MWAATAVGGVFQSTNQGTSWTVTPLINRELSDLTTSHYHNVAAANGAAGITLLLSTYEGMWTSPSNSISWQYIDIIPTRLARHVSMSPNYVNDQTLFANTYGGGNLWTSTGAASICACVRVVRKSGRMAPRSVMSGVPCCQRRT